MAVAQFLVVRRLPTAMSLTRQESRKELLGMKLPAAVLAVFDGHSPHPALSYRCQDPHYIFSTPAQPAGIHITPIWECGITVTAYQHSQPQSRFIRFSLEHSGDVKVIGASFQSVVADLLIDLWEDETSDEDLRQVARLFEFRHLDELLRDCERQPRSESYSDSCARRARFLEFCDAAA